MSPDAGRRGPPDADELPARRLTTKARLSIALAALTVLGVVAATVTAVSVNHRPGNGRQCLVDHAFSGCRTPAGAATLNGVEHVGQTDDFYFGADLINNSPERVTVYRVAPLRLPSRLQFLGDLVTPWCSHVGGTVDVESSRWQATHEFFPWAHPRRASPVALLPNSSDVPDVHRVHGCDVTDSWIMRFRGLAPGAFAVRWVEVTYRAGGHVHRDVMTSPGLQPLLVLRVLPA